MNTYDYIIRKLNINVGHQQTVVIPNFGRNNLAEIFAELGFKSGAEIGVDVGAYSKVLCNSNPGLRLYSIDPWSVSAYEPGLNTSELHVLGRQEDYESHYQEAKDKLTRYNCSVMRKTSMEAVKEFADNSLDFVYIDGNHDFVNASLDIHNWGKKVKNGGIVSGHDYKHFPPEKHNHVKFVVEAYVQAFGIRPLFVAGAKGKGGKGIIRDLVRSWFWVKT